MAAVKKRARRTAEQLIKDLEAKIEEVKRRAEQRKAKKDPTLRHVAGAVRAVDKALAETEDAATKKALAEARASLTAILALSGVASSDGSGGEAGARSKSGQKASADRVFEHIAAHPGGRSQDIAEALGTNTAGIRPALQRLKSAGKIKTKGKARATRYFAQSA